MGGEILVDDLATGPPMQATGQTRSDAREVIGMLNVVGDSLA